MGKVGMGETVSMRMNEWQVERWREVCEFVKNGRKIDVEFAFNASCEH